MTVQLSPEQEKAILDKRHADKAILEADNAAIAAQWQAHKDHYKVGVTHELKAPQVCYACHAKLPVGTKNVPTKTEILGDHNHNIKVTSFYFCPGGCKA